MARFSASARATGVGSATLPFASLYAIASRRLLLREVHVFNTTTTAVVVALTRFTTAGTPGAGVAVQEEDGESPAPVGTPFQAHSSTPPTLGDEIRRTDIGAAIGAGAIWTFDQDGLRIPPGTANGVGLYVPTGTAQICDFVFVWDE